MATTRLQGYFNVCTDCMVSAVNGEEPTDRPDSEPEVWALWQGTETDITPAFESDDTSFSWHACEGCGSTLGGDRFRFAWWGK